MSRGAKSGAHSFRTSKCAAEVAARLPSRASRCRAARAQISCARAISAFSTASVDLQTACVAHSRGGHGVISGITYLPTSTTTSASRQQADAPRSVELARGDRGGTLPRGRPAAGAGRSLERTAAGPALLCGRGQCWIVRVGRG